MSRWQLDRDKYLLPNELERLFSTLQRLESEEASEFRFRWRVCHMALDMCYSLGLRVSELKNIRHTDIDLVTELPNLFVVSKGGRKRYIPIPNKLKQHIEKFVIWKRNMGQGVKPDSYFLQSPKGGCYSISGLEQMFIESLKMAELPRRTIHSLRHAYAFQVYTKTKNLMAVKKLLGHSSISTTQVYLDVQFHTLSEYANLI